MSRMRSAVLLFLCFLLSAGPAGAKMWKERQSRHFEIYYDTAPVSFVATVEKNAERYYGDITRDMGFRRFQNFDAQKPVRIYIYNNQQDYVANRNIAWSDGEASPAQNAIRTFPAAHGFFDSTLPHELGHIIFRDFIGEKPQIPLWLEEGVAMYQEEAQRFGAHAAVKEALSKHRFVPLPELNKWRLSNKTPPEAVQLFYTEAASVVHYLISEEGVYRFVRFCRYLRNGQSFDEAFANVYARFPNLEKLNRSWVAYVTRQ